MQQLTADPPRLPGGRQLWPCAQPKVRDGAVKLCADVCNIDTNK